MTAPRSIYITAPEGRTGKSLVALGLVDLLTRRVRRVGVFRPVTHPDPGRDQVLDLLLERDGVDLGRGECIGVSYDDVHSDPEAALATIVERHRG